jgi:hypothetical protein
MWCWGRMEKISGTDHVRIEELLLRVKEQRNILHEISKRKANWFGDILRRNCLLRQVIEGKIKGGIRVTVRRGKSRKKLLNYLNPLTPELNPSAQRCLRRFLLGILLLEPCILLIYAWKTNKCKNYSFSLLIMYGISYMFRHYIAILWERS